MSYKEEIFYDGHGKTLELFAQRGTPRNVVDQVGWGSGKSGLVQVSQLMAGCWTR